MAKTRIIIFQILGIVSLLFGYFLSDQPDSLSVMHFDPNPVCPSVFSKASHTTDNSVSFQVSSTSHNNNTRKTSVPKYMSYDITPVCRNAYQYHPYNTVSHDFPLPENYDYLFYEEINPPPPKGLA